MTSALDPRAEAALATWLQAQAAAGWALVGLEQTAESVQLQVLPRGRAAGGFWQDWLSAGAGRQGLLRRHAPALCGPSTLHACVLAGGETPTYKCALAGCASCTASGLCAALRTWC